jgi:hypothetical protein
VSYSSRFWLFAPINIFLALAAVAMAHWWVVAGNVEQELDAMNGHEAAPGITLSFATKSVSGFPFNLDIVFTDFAIAGQGAHGPFRWTTENFALHRLTYGRIQDIYEAAGKQTLSWTDGGGIQHGLNFLPGSMRASAIADTRGLLRFDLDVTTASGHDSAGTPFTAVRSQLHLRRDPKADAMDLQISGDDIKTEGNIASLFGDHITHIALYATLTKGSAFTPLLAGTSAWPAASADWRAKGGQVTMGPVDIHSAGVSLTANAFSDTDSDLGGVLDPLY